MGRLQKTTDKLKNVNAWVPWFPRLWILHKAIFLHTGAGVVVVSSVYAFLHRLAHIETWAVALGMLVAVDVVLTVSFWTWLVPELVRLRRSGELNTAEKQQRRELVHCWRLMLVEIDMSWKDNNIDVGEVLRHHPDFLTLEPYIHEPLYKKASHYLFNARSPRVLLSNASLHPLLENLNNDIRALETKWGLCG